MRNRMGPVWVLAVVALARSSLAAADKGFEIRVVDDQTGRGVPMVELTTVSDVRFLTDSAGRVAIFEPGWEDQTVFFHVWSHGYEMRKDGFGFAGVRAKVTAGGRIQIPLRRLNIAERLYRTTGEGIYRDSVMLGRTSPIRAPFLNAQVAGQDSVQAAVFHGKIHWFWGDTDRLSYPLGQFRTSGAVSDLPGKGGLDPSVGVDLTYFVDQKGFSRPVAQLGFESGVVWIDGLVVVPDGDGKERLVCHYSHRKSLAEELEHGLAVFNDESNEFEKRVRLEDSNRWRHPHGHAMRGKDKQDPYVYFGLSFPNVRVKASLESILDPAQYESWTCLGENQDGAVRDAAGELLYRWTKAANPVGPKVEEKLFREGTVKESEVRLLPADVQSGKRIRMHRGSVRWNDHRKRWVLIANQEGGSSYLGEIWYSEAEELLGPWPKARKIVTHEKYSFYNPVHHPFFDQEGGRIIYFEGTYVTTFSSNEVRTPRYDYNQIMYRLDLDKASLSDTE